MRTATAGLAAITRMMPQKTSTPSAASIQRSTVHHHRDTTLVSVRAKEVIASSG
jgi:hypothetical protein